LVKKKCGKSILTNYSKHAASLNQSEAKPNHSWLAFGALPGLSGAGFILFFFILFFYSNSDCLLVSVVIGQM